MKMKNKENKDHEYWRHRFELIEDSQNRKAKFINKDVERAFKKAQSEIQGKIDKWISRIAKNNGITILEAYKMLSNSELDEFRWSLEEYIKKGKENSFNGKWIKQLENASAKAHITRLEALKIEVQQAIEEVYGYEHDQLDQLIRDSYSEGYYRPIFEFQRFFNVGWNPTSVNKNTLNKLVTKPWAPDDRTFSSRIWSNKSQMIDALDTELTKMCLTGAAPDKAIKHMAKFANGKFKNAKKAAGRLIMTESAYFSSKGAFDSYKELGIEEFEIVATLDSRTSAICREKDGQHFPLELYEIGVTAPPFHPWCRSCTCPYFDDEFSVGERIARGNDGKNYYVPSNMTYKEWEKEHIRDTFNENDQEQYERYKKVLKKNASDSIENFIEMKYNNLDKWENLKYQYRTVNRYEVVGNVTVDEILELDNAAWYTKNKSFDRTKVSGHYKKKVDRIIKSGNTATMKFENKIYFSHSSIEDLDDDVLSEVYNGEYQIVKTLDDRQFKELDLGDGIPREFDTEAKFLEFVASKKKRNDIFTVTILSEKHICASCENIVEQFKKAFPRATVNIVSGKKGYNDNPNGTKTWKHRKKVQK